MSKIYISYSHQDKNISSDLAKRLREAGHEIFMDSEVVPAGSEWRSALSKYLESSDIIVVLLTESSINSQYVMSEIGSARAFVNSSYKKKLLIPVILGNIPIPNVIQDLLAIVSDPPNIQDVFQQITQAIDAFGGRKAAEEEKEREIKKEIEASAAEYIEEAITELKQREKTLRDDANFWYRIGWGSLVVGVIVAIAISILGYKNFDPAANWVLLIFLALKGVIIVALLIASSKYAFSLAKSYMSESLKNSDRIHAISFGKFYLKAFGENVATSEIKEVFQHWNINNNSSFSSQNPGDFDPKIVESILAIAEVVKHTQKK